MNEKPWLNSYDPGLPHTLQPYPEITMIEALQDAARQRPDHLALIFKGKQITLSELEQLSARFASALEERGVKKGDRVMLLLPNSPQAIIAQFGAWMAGAIVCPTNPLYTEWELEHVMNESGAEFVITLSLFYAKVKALQPKTKVKKIIVTNIKDFLPTPLRWMFTLLKEKKEGYRVSLEPGDEWMLDVLKDNDPTRRPVTTVTTSDGAMLLFSGGTTGTPKAALGLHRSVLMAAMQLQAYARGVMEDWDDKLLLVMPMFHVYGNMALCTSILAHWPMVIVPNPRDLNDLIGNVQKYRPAILHGVPTLFKSLLNHPKVKSGQANFKSLKVCYSAAAPLQAETKNEFERLTGGRLLEAYGMTETYLAAVVCPVHGAYKVGSTGLPLPDVDVQIVDPETGERLIEPCAVGEIIIHAPQIMEGYWQRPEETGLMIRDGWVYTGDIGYLDEDGYLFLIDRKKDLIKPRGFQVWPSEVEEVVASHPAVMDVCVGGVPDAGQGEAVKAWIVLHPGQQISVQELQAYCRQKLTGYKVPKLIEFRETLPKTMVGKILRRMLVNGEG